ncbi:amidohydrolase family protein [Sphingomonas sp.]|uniref:amidohydrolase family protein n=1 Tax=Sphingomonas sp. TaxID=28214 RepID=UPI003B3B3EB5
MLISMACAPVAAVSTDGPSIDTLYSDATIIDGTGSPPKPHQDILVNGERIVAIGAHGSIARGGNARQVDVSQRFIIPGLIDSHVHLETPPDNAVAKAMLRRDLYGGVTAVRDMADDLRPVGELKREALVGEIPAPDIFYAALVAGPPFFGDERVIAESRGVVPGTAPWMQAIGTHADIGQAITLARGTSATAIKIYADLSPEQVGALTREAHRQHMLVWAHGAVFPARPADVIGAGVDVVSHACYLAYQAFPKMPAAYEDHTPVPDALIATKGDDPVLAGLFREMKRRGEILDATGRVFVAYEQAFKADPTHRPARCTGAVATRITAQAWRAGLAISTGTDNTAAPSQDWPEVHDELLFLARDVGMPPLQVLHSATLVGAEAAGQAADMGSLATGKLANFVVLRADPSVDIRNIRSIQMTVKRGRQYLRSAYVPTTRAEMRTDDGLVSIPAAEWAVPGQPASAQ